MTSRAEVAAAEDAARSAAVHVLAGGRHSGAQWYTEWAQRLLLDGTVTRLVRGGGTDLIRLAVAVLDELPAATEPLPALAERVTGDTKALTGTRLARLVLRALALREVSAQSDGGASALARVEIQRALWEAAGVIPDDLASQVLVLGLAAAPCDPLGRWLSEAADEGAPFRVTLQQLVSMPLRRRSPGSLSARTLPSCGRWRRRESWQAMAALWPMAQAGLTVAGAASRSSAPKAIRRPHVTGP